MSFWLKILVPILFFLVAFDVSTRKYINPYRLYLVFGKKGSGKSTYLVKVARRYTKKGWIVYTNMEEFSMPGLRHFNIQHLGDFVPEQNSVLLLDEVGMIWDARDFKAFKPSVRDFFKLQRHYKVIVYMASQTFDVDKKIRDLCDGMFLHTNFARVFTLGKRITRKVVLTVSTSESESRISEDLVMLPFWNWTLTYIPKYARYFDSHSIPPLPALKYDADPDTPSTGFEKYTSKIRSRLPKLPSLDLSRLFHRNSDGPCSDDISPSDPPTLEELAPVSRPVVMESDVYHRLYNRHKDTPDG